VRPDSTWVVFKRDSLEVVSLRQLLGGLVRERWDLFGDVCRYCIGTGVLKLDLSTDCDCM
jgi:hypothetical protein